jgi:hypothetical protein
VNILSFHGELMDNDVRDCELGGIGPGNRDDPRPAAD